MASVYKSISKANGSNDDKANGIEKAKAKPKQRVLILSSRGITYRHRHLLNDLYSLLPHSRKDAKLDTKTKLQQLNELADLYNCNNVLFFEARKGKDLYIWMSAAPNGPTVKCHLQNLHTMSELHFPGNCLKGSRPILSFDHTFTTQPYLLVVKDLLQHIFAVPKHARKTKPFVDHVMGFTVADGKIWVRVYEVKETEDDGKPDAKEDSTASAAAAAAALEMAKKSPKSKSGSKHDTKISLVEIGPRFVLTPIVILEGSFGGPVIYENKEFVSPNLVRSELRQKKSARFAQRTEQDLEEKVKKRDLGLKTGGQKRKREGDELDAGELFQ
ncbi:Ribosome biogenesis protein brx1 [Agyrium rufum]|nr:Ribosome biogenesis protein brx1 [Agyrium rufum]